MTKQQYKKVRALLLRLRKERISYDYFLFTLKGYRSTYIRFKSIKNSHAKQDYLMWLPKALAGPLGKLP